MGRPYSWSAVTCTPLSKLERVVGLNPERRNDAVRLRCHSDDRNQLGILSFSHSLGASGRRMGVDAVVTAVSNRDSHIEHLFGLGIKRSRTHHLLDALPRALERDRIVGECAP